MTDEVESVDSLTVKLLLSSVFYLTTAYGGAFPCRNGKPFVLRTFPLSREYLIKTGEALICSFVGATHAGCQDAIPYEMIFIFVYFINIMYIFRNVYGRAWKPSPTIIHQRLFTTKH